MLDAFDFFVVVFLFDTLAEHFHVSKASVVYTLTLTLAMRPLGALFFGALADRFGRKRPLIFCVLYFSLLTVLTGLAPNYSDLCDLPRAVRHRHGRILGHWRFVCDGEFAAAVPGRALRHDAGRLSDGLPAGGGGDADADAGLRLEVGLLCGRAGGGVDRGADAVRTGVRGVEATSAGFHETDLQLTAPAQRDVSLPVADDERDALPFARHAGSVSRFSEVDPGDRGEDRLRNEDACMAYPILYNIGAIVGALFFGQLSQKIGRRNAIMLALVISLLSIPAWAFGTSLGVLVVGSYLMQTGVQGAFGVIPAHLNELSPDAVRSLFPGFVYQLGVLLASPATAVEFVLRDHFGYPWALTMFEASVIVLMIVIFWFGPEARDRSFLARVAAAACRGRITH